MVCYPNFQQFATVSKKSYFSRSYVRRVSAYYVIHTCIEYYFAIRRKLGMYKK